MTVRGTNRKICTGTTPDEYGSNHLNGSTGAFTIKICILHMCGGRSQNGSQAL